MSLRFSNKVMVVTGAAQGIGRRVAELAAAEGARLVLVDIADYVQGVAAELRDQGAEALAVQADLETWDGAEDVMARASQHYGRIDILINNVGGTIWARPFEHYQPEQIRKEIQRSLFPTLWCCRAVLPYMGTTARDHCERVFRGYPGADASALRRSQGWRKRDDGKPGI